MSIDLRYDDLEEELRSNVRDMLADRCPPSRVLDWCEGDEPLDTTLWRTVAVEMGLAGLAMPEKYGGGGASLREAAVVLEELGRAVAPVPYLGSAIVATGALLASDEGGDLLADLAGGARHAVLAVPFTTMPYAPVTGTVTAHGDRLTGRVTGVADALGADVLLVPTVDGLWEVAAGAVTRTPVVSLDLTRRLCDVDLVAAPGRRLAGDAAAATAGITAGAALLASEQLGVAEWCLQTTVEYLKLRHQFGRPLGSYQALKHRLADLWVELTQARAVARYAAGCVSSGDPDTPIAIAVAQAHCSAVAVRAAEECVQMHGGIGFTWEHPAHLYLKRAKSAAIAFGTPDRHRSVLAGLVDLPS